jgi:ribonuclease Z
LSRDGLPESLGVSFGGLSLEAFSRSTVATFFHLPELGVLIDAGACPGTATSAADVFVSHLHVDHAQALPYYVSHRNMLRMAPGRIHLPPGTAGGVRAWLDQVAALQGPEGGRFAYELDEMEPGEERALRGRHAVRAFGTDHGVPSLGFTVLERREKLLPEHIGLGGEEIGRRKRAGETVTRTVETPIVTFLTDTGPKALDLHPEVGQSEVLVAECTFLAPEHLENARATRHLHLQDFVDRAALFSCRTLVLTHFSLRYKEEEIRDRVRRSLPKELFERVALLP